MTVITVALDATEGDRHDDREQQEREGRDDLHDPRQHAVDDAAEEAGREAGHQRDDHRQDGRRDADEERRARAVRRAARACRGRARRTRRRRSSPGRRTSTARRRCSRASASTGSSVRSSVPVEFDLFSVWPVNCSNSGAAAANANSQKMNTVQPMPTLSRRRRAQACCQGLRATTPFSGAKPGAGAVRLRASAVATHELHRRMHPDPPCAADVTAHALRMPPHEAHD